MINLMRGELYKMVRSKCFYICCIAVTVFSFALYGMFSLADAVQKGKMVSENFVVTTEVGSVWEDMSLFSIAKVLFSTAGILIVSVYVAISLFGDYANGAIKNVVGKGYKRNTVFFSKFLNTAVGAVLIELALSLGVLVCELLILRGERLTGKILVSYCGYVGMQLLFAAALAGIMLFINQVCRNLGLGIAISVCLVMFSSIITMGINTVLQYFHMNVNVCDYWVIDLISECPSTEMESGFLVRAVICSIIWIVVSLVAGNIHFGKVDVK